MGNRQLCHPSAPQLRPGRRRDSRPQRTGEPAGVPAGGADRRPVHPIPVTDSGGPGRQRRRQRKVGRPVRARCALRQRRGRNVGAARAVGFGYARSLCGRRHRVLVRHHRRRQPGGPGLAGTSAGPRRRHGSGRGACRRLAPAFRRPRRPVCAGLRGGPPIRMASTSTSTARTWASAPGLTGGWAAFARWPPERMSIWSSGSRPPATGFTGTPSCRSPRRRASGPGLQADSPTTSINSTTGQ